MNTRRTFIKKSLLTGAAVAITPLPACVTMDTTKAKVPMKSGEIGSALVLWYSQTGNTHRCGRVLAHTLAQKGMRVESFDLRGFQREKTGDFDLLVLGSPVFYYDIPAYVKEFIRSLPDLKGIPVASFVTFGGPEGNQDNANYSILQLLSEQNGVPVAGKSFQSISSFPMGWSKDRVDEKTWNARHLPDEQTFQSVRDYAGEILAHIKANQSRVFVKKLTLRESYTFFDLEWWTKILVKNHSLVRENCVQCGACVEKCPVAAIDLDSFQVDTDSCVLCFGCLNNCEYQAVHMEYSRENLIGFQEFLKQHHLDVYLPAELQRKL